MYKSIIELLGHIDVEVKFVLSAIRNKTFDEFYADELLKRGVTRSIEIIGEASKNIHPDFKKDHPQIEWKQIARMRDKLIHHYAGVDYTIVWNTIVNSFPEIEFQVEQILQDNKDNPIE